MPRQPFVPTYRGKPVSIAPFSIDEMPKLAELVGRIAINWSGVDLHLALLLGSMLGTENPASVAVFLSLRNHRAQRDALTAAAEKSLTPELKQLFDAILYLHRQMDGQRNDVVHGVWGRAPDTPDGIVWNSLQDHANMLIVDYHSAGKVQGFDRAEHIVKDLFVYRYEDLEKLNSDIRKLADAIRNFHAHLRYRGQAAGDSALSDLRADPLVQGAVAQLAPRPKTA